MDILVEQDCLRRKRFFWSLGGPSTEEKLPGNTGFRLCLDPLATCHRSQLQSAYPQPMKLLIQAAQCALSLAASLGGTRGCR